MEINLLVLNVGNSRLAIGVFLAGELQYSTRIANDNRADFSGVIGQAWKKISERENAAVVAISVNPALNEHLEHVVHQVTGKNIEWIGRDIKLPIKVLTD